MGDTNPNQGRNRSRETRAVGESVRFVGGREVTSTEPKVKPQPKPQPAEEAVTEETPPQGG